MPAAPAVAGATTTGTTKVTVGAYSGTGGNQVADSKTVSNHDGNLTLSASDSDTGGMDGPADGTASITSSATPNRVTASGTATANQFGGDVQYNPTSLSLETILTTAGQWVYEGSFTSSSTTTPGMCVSGSVHVYIYAPGSTDPRLTYSAYEDCEGTMPASGTESFGDLDSVGVALAAGSKIKIGASITAPSSSATGSSTASFTVEVREKLPPVSNTAQPVLSGSGEVGTALTTSNGAWQGSPNAFTYQWKSGGADVPGATAATFAVRPVDVGKLIQCYVTASNGASQSSQYSNGVFGKTVPQPLTNTKKPNLTGQAKVGKTLTVSPGTWSPSPTSTTYQWLRNGKPISGATSATYKLKGKDEGKKVSVAVTVKSSGYVDSTATSKAKKVKPKS
jgi:hypothetical protein